MTSASVGPKLEQEDVRARDRDGDRETETAAETQRQRERTLAAKSHHQRKNKCSPGTAIHALPGGTQPGPLPPREDCESLLPKPETRSMTLMFTRLHVRSQPRAITKLKGKRFTWFHNNYTLCVHVGGVGVCGCTCVCRHACMHVCAGVCAHVRGCVWAGMCV